MKVSVKPTRDPHVGYLYFAVVDGSAKPPILVGLFRFEEEVSEFVKDRPHYVVLKADSVETLEEGAP